MQNNISNIINNAINIDKSILNEKNIKLIIKQIKEALYNNKDIIYQANMIDIDKNNGYLIDFNIIDNIFKIIDKEKLYYGSTILLEKDDENNIFYGKEILDIGNVLVINDGNPYTIIEIVLRNIIVGNTVIISNNGFMYGTNNLLIQIIQTVFEQINISKNFVQLYTTEDYDFLQDYYANIDLIICIGDRSLQNIVLSKSKVKTIVSGYEHFDIYIDDLTHLDFINKIINSNLDIQLFVNANLNIDFNNSITVNDLDEAIAQINYIGSSYSATIFTSSSKLASKFIREVKANMVTVNTSPSIERIMDINESDLYNEKKIIYPNSFKFNNKISLEINNN